MLRSAVFINDEDPRKVVEKMESTIKEKRIPIIWESLFYREYSTDWDKLVDVYIYSMKKNYKPLKIFVDLLYRDIKPLIREELGRDRLRKLTRMVSHTHGSIGLRILTDLIGDRMLSEKRMIQGV